MVLEWTKLIEKIRRKLDLVPEYQSLFLRNGINLGLDVKDALMKPRAYSATKAVTGTGAVVAFTVPEGHRWILKAWQAYCDSGVFTVGSISITDVFGNLMYFQISGGYSEASGSRDMALDEGYTISIFVSAYTSTGNAKMEIYVHDELLEG